MATARKKASRSAKAPATKASWSDTIKTALKKKKQASGGWPDQGKPRDSTVQKVKKDAF